MNIDLKGIKKSFGSNTVLNNVNIDIHSGDIMLIVGKNGAGKTTILRLILGLYMPDEGNITIDGVSIKDPKYKELKKKFGFLNDNIGLFRDLTAWENIEFFHRIYNPKANKMIRDNEIKNILQKVDLYDKKDKKIDFFSRGMRQRLAIGRAIVNTPELLILDEPNRGLDVEGKELLKDIVNEYHKKGATVLINSHDLNDIQEYVTHLSFLDKGEIVYSGSYSDLIKNQKNKKYKIVVENPQNIVNQLSKLDFVKSVDIIDNALIVDVSKDSVDLSKWFNENKIEIYELTQTNNNLVSLYKQYIK